MTKQKPSHDVVTRPAAKSLSQHVSAGIAHLLGEEAPDPTAAMSANGRKGRREVVSAETARVTFALRYRQSYMDRLEHLYLRERASRRKLAKADLVEEALDLLFSKYDLA